MSNLLDMKFLPMFLGLGLMVLSVTVVLVQSHRRWGPQRRVLKSGEPAEATVLDRNDLETKYEGGSKYGYRAVNFASVVLEVRREGQPAYRALCKQWFGSDSWLVREGEVVPVRIDRQNPELVYIDTDAKLRLHQAAQEAERERKAKRQERMMRG
jgi:hypothetical protein